MIIFTVVFVYVIELSVGTFRKAPFPTDTDVFQGLEQDQVYKEWFEEATVSESRENRKGYRDRLVYERNRLDIQLDDS